MREYEVCAKCGRRYNVSRLRDRERVFICEDCVRADKAKLTGKRQMPVYDKRGFARVSDKEF